MATIPSPRFYVYTLARPDGSIFYVGKGSGRRVRTHEDEARYGRCQCRRCRTIQKIWKAGGEVQRTIIFTTDDEVEAYAYEAETIAQFKPGVLCNLTSGGDGMSDPSPETRARLRESCKAVWDVPGYREKMLAILQSPGYRERVRNTVIALQSDPAHRENLRAKQKANWEDPDYRARQSAAMAEGQRKPEARARMRAGRKARPPVSPETRDRMSAGIKAAYASPESFARKSAATKANWEDPDYRARQTASRKAAWVRRKARSTEES
jgi:Uncharacterized protein conserved in bacteria